MLEVTKTERGWAGHFICAERCAFHRNTLLECGEVRIVVSTVGKFRSSFDKEIETIGCDRYYETMAFHAQLDEGIYWDADVAREVGFDSQWTVDHLEVYADAEANAMHEAVVSEIAENMAQGEYVNAV